MKKPKFLTKLKNKIRNLWIGFKAKMIGVYDWMMENPELAVVIIPTVLSALGWVLKKTLRLTIRSKNNSEEYKLKNLYVYDRSAGHYWKLKRELSNDEKLYIEKQREKGRKYGDILDDLKVLK